METKTRKQRREVYLEMLKDWEKPVDATKNAWFGHITDEGFCRQVSFRFKEDLVGTFKRKFPELYKQRETHKSYLWHYKQTGATQEGRDARIKALKRAIELTEMPWWKRLFIWK